LLSVRPYACGELCFSLEEGAHGFLGEGRRLARATVAGTRRGRVPALWCPLNRADDFVNVNAHTLPPVLVEGHATARERTPVRSGGEARSGRRARAAGQVEGCMCVSGEGGCRPARQ